jgi:hypothetical protein
LGTRDEILKKDWDEKIQKQISDAIYYKVEKCLKNEPWRIRRSSTGEYALVPRQLSETLPDGVCSR